MTAIHKALTERDSYFNGCLNARVAFESSRILGCDDDFPTPAHLMARDAGWRAFCLGIDSDNVPTLLKCDEQMIALWKDGWDCADELLSMDHCHECNNGTGNPCSFHG